MSSITFFRYTVSAFTLRQPLSNVCPLSQKNRGNNCIIGVQHLFMRMLSLLLLACLLFTGTAKAATKPAQSEDFVVPPWKAILSNHDAAPQYIIAVDKKLQQLYIHNPGKNFNTASAYICTTGQITGDKQNQGDLKTPEGIYFIVQYLNTGLDYTLYGKEAYTLNYPNPIDRVRRKTGYGIWIHGRGEAISPLQTQGCVAMNNTDLETIGKLLTPGTPVVLSSSLAPTVAASIDDATIQTLTARVLAWNKTWAQRSAAFFDFYAKDAYSIAQNESFSRFQSQKERLFKNLPWIKTSIGNVQVLQGPGYWVTWFHQQYDAPNLTTEGVRRLYWVQNSKGEFLIHGMEWLPNMVTGSMMASAEPATPPIDAAPKTEEQTLPKVQLALGGKPAQNQMSSSPETIPTVSLPTASTIPAKKPMAPTEIVAMAPAIAMAMAESAPATAMGTSSPPPPPASTTLASTAATTKNTKEELTGNATPDILATVEAWRKAWENGNISGYIQFYAPSANQGSRSSAEAIQRHKKSLWARRAPATVSLRKIQVVIKDSSHARAEMIQEYTDKAKETDKGKKVLTFERIKGKWLIIDEDWSKLETSN